MPKHPINRRKSQADISLAILSIKKADVTLLTGKRRMLILLSPTIILLFNKPNRWFYVVILEPFFE